MTRETREQTLERLIAEREAETPSERQARAIGYPKRRPDEGTTATERAAAKLTGSGDE